MRRGPVVAVPLAVLALSVTAAVSPTDAQRRPVAGLAVPVENSTGLGRFHDALRALRDGRRERVRVAHWGDSNVAADLWTSVTRERLQRAYGDGGPGYLVPLPWGSRFDRAIVLRAIGAWQPTRYGFARDYGPTDGLWGVAGVAVEARAGSTLEVQVPAPPAASVVEVHVLGRPRGGVLEIAAPGSAPRLVDAARPSVTLLRERVELRPDERRVRIRVRSVRPVRVLGVVVERRGPGVVYDVLGVNGHRVSAHSEWNRQLLAEQLTARPPDLAVLSYGGNEALDRGLTMARYETQLRAALAQLHELAPRASCLVVSPVAMCPRSPRNVEVTEIQRRLAAESGCAFFHTARVSGGHGSLCDWIRANEGLVSADRLHLARRGYALVGERFTDAILPDL